MPESTFLIPAESPQWQQLLAGAPHDFHHTAAHHLVWQEDGAGHAYLAVYGSPDRFVAWPYLLREIPDSSGLRDITGVDGYGGPLFRGCAPDEPFVAKALESIFGRWRADGVVTVFARFHPVLLNQTCFGDSSDACANHPGVRHEGHTVSMDLTLEDGEARKQYRSSHCQQIRRALKDGMTFDVDSSPSALDEFLELYYQTMERNGASPHYFFRYEFLDRLRQALAPAVSIHRARLNGKTVAASFITEYRGIVQVVLSGMDGEASRVSPLKPLYDAIRQWARARGNRVFHLGGGRGCRDEDPLFYFKSGFSERRHCFYTGRWILDRPQYDALVRRHGSDLDASADFFPAYRAPIICERRQLALQD
jgi:hypothetical protein